MSPLSDLLLTALLNHGTVLLGAVLYLAALGVPLPATMLLCAAGAFAWQGHLPPLTAALAGWLAAVAGDASGYLLARHGAQRLPAAWQARVGASGAARLLARWGVWAVFITRFAITPLALPVNVLAGSTRMPVPAFGLAVLLGEALWVALFGGLGYAFANRWEAISALTADLGGLLLGIGLLAAGLGALLLRRRGQPPR